MRISIILILSIFVISAVRGAVIRVYPKDGSPGFLNAIERAVNGDTILVGAGSYQMENIVIKKSLSIIGEGRPTLDGNYKVEIFTIAAPNVTIEGFRIINSGTSSIEDKAGIKCLDAHFVSIKNNILENTFFGIHLSNSNYSLIEGNVLKSQAEHEYQTGNGIHLWNCTHASIQNNEVTGHRDGIYFEFVTNSEICGNLSYNNNRYGLHFMFSHDDEYYDNVFRNNGAGVSVMYTKNVRMYSNVFEENWGSSSYGMLLKDISDSEVYNNVFRRNTTGIYMEGSSRILFHQNRFMGNGWAVKLQASCDDNVFEKNNFTANTFDISTNGTLVLNKIDGNYWDKYQGYDLARNGIGDIPYYPVNLFSILVERVPSAIMLWRSFLVFLLDKAEKVVPAITPENLKDNEPRMRPYDIS